MNTRHDARACLAVAAFVALLASAGGRAQEGSAGPIVAVRAGRLFDAKAGRMLTGQTVLIRGDRIADVGPSVQVPAGAQVIDLGSATLLPGMIDAHVHVSQNLPNESTEH